MKMNTQEEKNRLRHLERAFLALEELAYDLEETQQELKVRVNRLSQSLRSFQSQRQRQLMEREQTVVKQTAVLEALPAAMAVLDAADRIVQANSAARALLGTPLYGLTWKQIQQRVFAASPEHALCNMQGQRFKLLRQIMQGEIGQILLFSPVD
jgi:two-component system sensor histidine kinase FlrB